MDGDQGSGLNPASSPTPPLRIRKQPIPVRVSRRQSLNNRNKSLKHSSNPSYPPRTSSILRDTNTSSKANCHEKIYSRRRKINASSSRSATSNAVCTSISDPSIGNSTARSTVPSYKERYLSGSTEIIGDFVPVNAEMALPSREAEQHTHFSNA